MNRTEKAVLIEKIREKAEVSSLAVVADFKGMPVEEMTTLRAKLRESGAELLVVKNTLARIALTGGKHDVIKDNFRENCAIAVGTEDPIPMSKVVNSFAKTSKTFKVRHASLDGKFLNEAQLDQLAKLPSRDELLAKALGTMNAVPTNFVSVLANVVRGMLNVLKAIEGQKAA